MTIESHLYLITCVGLFILTCNKSVTTGSDSDLNETSLSRDVMAVDPVDNFTSNVYRRAQLSRHCTIWYRLVDPG